ncbi:isoamylase early set domain-containing protein [Psychroflexus planctonicus]|uniref:1,4-alpha-glucan-branching protein n=1 Tax=Psychroflexus planctonicus TaxID=1526575 RepID=A0ABQ1SJ12_9FLAO|nr:isoamylase early set domain-containing protein [Psychroflexus planctonicus]GGE38857.1 1,4-alpha-glucan-branching protein [Psychroflexus planctonicus]
MAIKKQYLKTKPICKVTFHVTQREAEKVVVAGDFNNWNENSFELRKLKNGVFKGSINLEKDKEYEFKYIIDGHWANDDEADAKVFNEYATENSILVL